MEKYPIYCAWCDREGKQTIVGYSCIKDTSGICKEHIKRIDELLKQERKDNGNNTMQ